MANGQLQQLATFANLQMAAEGFLSRAGDDRPNRPDAGLVEQRLFEGNSHASKFTRTQSSSFVKGYEVLAQYRNDPLLTGGTGFSGTLFRNKLSGELTLSFRSTEFIDDNIRDSFSTNKLEVKELGWAFGQIAEMEDWYAALCKDPELLGRTNTRFNVTGYSLGGHLATAFNILRREEAEAGLGASPVIATYTFNGAGVGDLKPGKKLRSVLAEFRNYRSDADVTKSAAWASLTPAERIVTLQQARSRALAVANEYRQVKGLSDVTFALQATEAPMGEQATVRYQIAALLAGRNTIASSLWFGDDSNKVPFEPKFADSIGSDMFPSMIEIVGSDSGNLGPSFVSNSGVHYGTRREIFIEDQPLTRGTYIVRGFPGDLVSNPGQNDFADTHSLVLLQDSLALMAAFERIDPNFTADHATSIFSAISSALARGTFGTQGVAEGDVLERALDALREIVLGPGTAPVNYAATLPGNTWHLESLRSPFHDNLRAVNDRIAALSNEPLFSSRLVVLAGKSADELQSLAESAGGDGAAYRYALRKLNPFAVLGFGYDPHNAGGQLDLYDPDTGNGVSASWIEARAAFLRAYSDYRISNGRLSQQAIGGYFEDQALQIQIGRSHEFSQRFVFASDSNQQVVTGSLQDDYLFGGNGADTITGDTGNDYLEGGPGNDTLTGGRGDDTLDGGRGFDTYIYADGDGNDSILDFDGRGLVSFRGRNLSGGTKVAEGIFESPDKTRYQLIDEGGGGCALLIDGNLRIEDFENGALGILLEGEIEPDTPPESAGEYSYFNSELPAEFHPNSNTLPEAFVVRAFGSRRDDYFYTTNLGVPIAGRAGNDVAIFGSEAHYAMPYEMGAGDDFIDATASTGATPSAYLSGGSGNDFILGGQGSDRIWGDNYLAFSLEIFAGARPGRTGVFIIDDFVYNLDSGPGFGSALYLPPGSGAFKRTYDDAIRINVEFSAGIPAELLADGSFVQGSLRDALVGVLGESGTFDDFIDGGDGDDDIVGGSGSDHILGGPGDDILFGDYEAFRRSGGEPSYFGLKTYFGELAALFGRPGDDNIDGGPGDDLIRDEDGGNDILYGGEGNDEILSREGRWIPGSGGAYNTISGDAGNDYIEVSNETGGFEVVDGGNGDDTISVFVSRFEGGAAGRAFVFGGAGNDVIVVQADYGFVDGGSGDDKYTVSGEFNTISDAGGNDTFNVILPNVAQVDAWLSSFPATLAEAPMRNASARTQGWTVSREGGDLVFRSQFEAWDRVEASSELAIENWFVGAEHRIERIVNLRAGGVLTSAQFEAWGGAHYGSDFADELLDYSEHSDRSAGGGGDDVIATGDGDDHLYGGRGDDYLAGGAGNDTYHYARGDGDDVIEDLSGMDEIRFGPGISIAEMAVELDESGLTLTLGGGSLEILGASRGDPGIERLRFSDGTSAMLAELLPLLPQTELRAFELDLTGVTLEEEDFEETVEPGIGAEGAPSPVVQDVQGVNAPTPPIVFPDNAVELPDLPLVVSTLDIDDAVSNVLPIFSSNTPAVDAIAEFLAAGAQRFEFRSSFGGLTAEIAPDESEALQPGRAGSGSTAPLDLQTLLEAVEAFSSGQAGPARENDAPSQIYARVQAREDQALANSPGINSWVLTNALLQFHLEQAAGAGDAPIADAALPTSLLASLSTALGRQSLSLPAFGQQAPSLSTFSGLQEGFTRL